MGTNLALLIPALEEMLAGDSCGVPSNDELDSLDDDIAAVDVELSAASHLVLDLRDRRETLLTRRAEILFRRERSGLFETGELIKFYSIEHVGPVQGNKGQ